MLIWRNFETSFDLQGPRQDFSSVGANKALDALEKDTKCEFPGNQPWQSTISQVWGAHPFVGGSDPSFVWIGIIRNFTFLFKNLQIFFQIQYTFLGNVWVGWYRFDFGPFQWCHYLEFLHYFSNVRKVFCLWNGPHY